MLPLVIAPEKLNPLAVIFELRTITTALSSIGKLKDSPPVVHPLISTTLALTWEYLTSKVGMTEVTCTTVRLPPSNAPGPPIVSLVLTVPPLTMKLPPLTA